MKDVLSRPPALWAAAAAGPLAWFVQLTVGWAIVPPAHHQGRETALAVLSAAALAVALAAAAAGVMMRRALPAGSDDPAIAGRRLIATAALLLGAVTALLIACTALPLWLLGAGVEP